MGMINQPLLKPEAAALDTANPIAALSGLIQSGQLADPAVVREYMEMAQKWRAEESRRAYAEAMTAAQAEMPIIVKDKNNPQTRSRYPSIEAVQRAIKATCIKHGLTVTFSDGQPPKDGWVRVVAQVRHVDGHIETYHRDGPIDSVGLKGSANKTELHGVQSTATYLMRHLLCGIFNLVIADTDDDGGGSSSTITDEQALTLESLLDETGSDVARFKAHFGIETIADMPTKRYAEAVSLLRKKAAHAGN